MPALPLAVAQAHDEILLREEKPVTKNTQTRLTPGTRVRTVKPPVESSDWTPDAHLLRRWDVTGTVLASHDSHGLYYDVLHDDDQRKAPYEQRELESVP